MVTTTKKQVKNLCEICCMAEICKYAEEYEMINNSLRNVFTDRQEHCLAYKHFTFNNVGCNHFNSGTISRGVTE